MGLDIYVGTLTRYYAQNWKTITQQWAEANGMGFQRITPNGNHPAPDASEVQKAATQWRDEILRAVSPPDGPAYKAWQENNQVDYFTDKPDWDAFGALLLYGVCRRYKLELPGTVEKGWDFSGNEILKRGYEDPELNWSLYTGVTWWIPIEDKFSFGCRTPTGNEISAGTTGTLLAELQRINELGWQADHKSILEWRNTEGYPADASIVNGQYQPLAENMEYNTESLAKFAFSIMYQAALFSQQNNVPIIMDY